MIDPWTRDVLVWGIQVLVVAALIHVCLRFVRATRGNRLIRGVLVGVLGGYLGLLVFATLIGADELEYLLNSSSSFLVVALAIVFQSELRRGIAQIGERSFVGRLIQPAARDTLTQVAKAAASMSSQRIGALITFERETSLRSYIEEGTPIDADVNARLLESLFHPGTALHDGAVIIKGDRIAAAGCFFPLPQEAELDASLGTRHRAAVGITEDTDSVVVVVSEETGRISIAREGQIASRIDPTHLEESLQRILQRKDTLRGLRRPSMFPRTRSGWMRELSWIMGSVLVATSLLFLSWNDMIETDEITVLVRAIGPGTPVEPQAGEIVVLLPDEETRLLSPSPSTRFTFEIEAKRGKLDDFGSSPAGVYDLTRQGEAEDAERGEASRDLQSAENGQARTSYSINLEAVVWEKRVPGIEFQWLDAPALVTERTAVREFEVQPPLLAVENDTDAGDYFLFDTQGMVFERPGRTTVALRGPTSVIERLDIGDPSSVFAPLELVPNGLDVRPAQLELREELVALGVTMPEPAVVLVPRRASERALGTISAEVALVCLDNSRIELLDRFRLPAHRYAARFRIVANGLFPDGTELDSQVWSERVSGIMQYLREQLYVFVDVAEVNESSSTTKSVTVRYGLREPDWRNAVAEILLEGESDAIGERIWPLDALTLQIQEEDEQILLEEKEQE